MKGPVKVSKSTPAPPVRRGLGQTGQLDLVIVGAGPAGFAASLGAMQAGLSFVTLEQYSLGGTLAHFPRVVALY